MKIFINTLLIFSTFLSICAAENYERNVAKWIEILRPPESKPADRALWVYRANDSRHDWIVAQQANDTVIAYTRGDALLQRPRPDFECKVNRFQRGSTFYRTGNGWLVGFNEGEWGGALYWFSAHGQKHIKISDHQIVDFISYQGRVFAIEGLAHLSLSEGSIIEIKPSNKGVGFTVSTLLNLPEAPEAAAFMRNGTLVLALSDSLALWSETSGLQILMQDATWGLYSNSLVISNDEKIVYIGMRQYVGEYNFSDGTFRYLIPNEKFQNYLPKEEEDRIRTQYNN